MERFDVETWYESDKETVAYIALHGANNKVRNEGCLNEYQLVSGKVSFVIDGDFSTPIVLSKPGVLFRVPAGTVYQDFGENAVMLCTSTPPFDPDQVTVVE
jgi:hypothetical protein